MFTAAKLKNTPTDSVVIMNIDENAFRDFTFVNPYFTDFARTQTNL
jgi:hypothetical protein